MTVYTNSLIFTSNAPGTSAAIAGMLWYYNLTSYTYCTTTIPFQRITTLIDANFPVIITMGGTNGDKEFCHAAVVCGYLCESDGTDYIQILDSNISTGKIWISINRNTNAIRYVTSDVVYTIWYETVYSSVPQ